MRRGARGQTKKKSGPLFGSKFFFSGHGMRSAVLPGLVGMMEPINACAR